MVFEKLKKALTGEEKEKKEVKIEEISIDEARDRAENKKGQFVQDVEKGVEDTLRKISNLQNKIENLNKNLSDAESGEEVHPNLYKSANQAKSLFVKKVDKAIGKINVPSEPDWNELIDFNRSLQNEINLLKNADVSHGQQVSALFGDQISRFRRLVERLSTLSAELNTTLRKTKIDINDLNEFLNNLTERDDLLEEKERLKEKLEGLRDKKEEIEEEYEKKEDSLESLKRSERFDELERIKKKRKRLGQEKERVRKEIDSTISDITRPLRKMDKMIERDDHMVGKQVLEALEAYLDDPVQAVLSEKENLPKFKKMLQELKDLLEGKMKLSERERRKRLEEVQDILENKNITQLRKRYFEIEDEREELKNKIESSSLLEKKENIENSLYHKKSELNSVEDKIEYIEEELSNLEKQVENKEEKIQESAKSLFSAELKD
ncbi:hypothetical protein AKJ53_01090 [candidate division MSBL1 archaeon SCGC-AAA382F02]|uniref:Uncharacterized protein n=1 Tax=candidate division MSBL1 archaeon SCGC-AAA382F02 TaxID=1698282 RepID=A0A133VIG4_9EURY|nr:hypothetical protein AKJ53_01090 [candidate division MSBL1 archaeon SCGC-AAA382F02]